MLGHVRALSCLGPYLFQLRGGICLLNIWRRKLLVQNLLEAQTYRARASAGGHRDMDIFSGVTRMGLATMNRLGVVWAVFGLVL